MSDMNNAILQGTFVDERDEHVYRTVKVGNTIWLAENLAFLGNGVPANGDKECVAENGCLYTWNEARRACPEGWRLPCREDFRGLLYLVGAAANSDGFSARGALALEAVGFIPQYSGSLRYGLFSGFDRYSVFWSSTDYSYDEDMAEYRRKMAIARVQYLRAKGVKEEMIPVVKEVKLSQEDRARNNQFACGLGINRTRAVLGFGAKHYAFAVRCVRDVSTEKKIQKGF